MRAPSRPYFLFACLVLVVSSGGLANQKEFKSSTASSRQNMDCSTKASAFEPFTLAWLVDGNPPIEDGEQSIRCTTEVLDGGVGRKGVKVTLEGELLDLDGDVVADLGSQSGKTDKNGHRVFDFDVSGRVADGQNYLARVDGRYATRKKIETAKTTCVARDRRPCVDSKETLCLLNDNRFKVEVDWSSSSESGAGQVISSSNDTGTFYFFNPNNTDLLVQLLNACSNNDHFWVFAQAQTNVEFALTVTDTETGTIRSYSNPDAFEPILDTSAFATCP